MHLPTIVQALIERGVSIIAQDNEGATAMKYAEELAAEQSSDGSNDVNSKADASILSYLKTFMLQKDWSEKPQSSRHSMRFPSEKGLPVLEIANSSTKKLDRPVPTSIIARSRSDESIQSSAKSSTSGASKMQSKLNKSVNDATSDIEEDGDLEDELDNVTEDEWVSMGFPREEYQERLRVKMAKLMAVSVNNLSPKPKTKVEVPAVTMSGVVISDGTLNLFGKSVESLRRSSDNSRPQSEFFAGTPRTAQTMGRRPSSVIENSALLSAYRMNSSAKDLLRGDEVVYNPLSRRGSVALTSAPKLDEIFGNAPKPSHMFSLVEASRKLTQGSGNDMFRSNGDLQSNESSKSKSSIATSAQQISNPNIPVPVIEDDQDKDEVDSEIKLRASLVKWSQILGHDDLDSTADLSKLMATFQNTLQLFYSDFENLEAQLDESAVYKNQVKSLTAQLKVKGLQNVSNEAGDSALRDDLVAARLEIEALTSKLSQVYQNDTALQVQLSEAEDKIATLETEMESRDQREAGRIKTLKSQLEELQNVNAQLQTDSGAERDCRDALQSELDTTKAELQRDTSTKHEELQFNIRDQENLIADLEQQVATMSSTLRDKELTILDLQADLTDEREQVEQGIKEQTKILKQQNDLRAQYETLKKKVPAQDGGLSQQAIEMIATMKRELMSKEDDIFRLKRNAFLLETQLEERNKISADRPMTPTVDKYREKVSEKEMVYELDTRRRKDSAKDADIDDGIIPEPFTFSAGMFLNHLT